MIQRNVIPYVCFFCGLGAASNFDSAVSFYSGSLLMLLACMAWLKQLDRQYVRSRDSTSH